MLSLLSKFHNRIEEHKSRDEMLIGEIVFAMAHLGCPTIGFQAGSGAQYVKFKPADDPVLHSFTVQLDRTGDGGNDQAMFVIGSRATLSFVGEVKNHLADPDDLVQMLRTDIANLFRIPWLGNIKLDHELNSVTGTKKQFINIGDFIDHGQEGRQALYDLLRGTLGEMHSSLAAYKKS